MWVTVLLTFQSHFMRALPSEKLVNAKNPLLQTSQWPLDPFSTKLGRETECRMF